MRHTRVTDAELASARDFLVGVFPLRFETAGAVAGALAGLAVHGLPLDELIDYRARIEAVDIDAISQAGATHLHLDDAAVVMVGDVDAFGSDLEAAGLGRIIIERDEVPGVGPVPADETPGPIDEEVETGPTAGAEEPGHEGSADEPAPTPPGSRDDRGA
jgi:hypothetical protein